jgi:hypothetical protein
MKILIDTKQEVEGTHGETKITGREALVCPGWR